MLHPPNFLPILFPRYMNTAVLKSFAPEARRQLMEAVTRRLDYVLAADTPALRQAAGQVAALRKQANKDRTGLIERVAYTWFNRLAALRFLDAQGWHPFQARVLTAVEGETQPELLKLFRTGTLPAELQDQVDATKFNDLLDGRLPTAIAGADPQGEVYRHLVLGACRYYHRLLPDVFEKLDDETELLLPDDLLTATSVAEGFRTKITDEDCASLDESGKARANVEVLGWLYQFYISEKKDAVMARKKAVPTEDIPAVTQLFTPHWIVRYLVENSLGRLWLLNRPQSRLKEHMPYYIEGEPETDFLKISKPEEIKVVDPACGSGHMLTYAFDLLFRIYEEDGHAPTEIPALILRHNLHGLEICPRAAQLAELALVFKARDVSRRFFQPGRVVRPNIIELQDVKFGAGELKDYIAGLGLGDLFNQPVLKLLHQFEETKSFGSLIQPSLSEGDIQELRRVIEAKDLGGQLFLRDTHLKVLRVLEQAEALTQRYHVVAANPPYMGLRGMEGGLKMFLESAYPEAKHDLYTSFIDRTGSLAVPKSYIGMVTMQGWLFLSSFTAFRSKFFGSSSFINLAQLGARAFDSIVGEVVQTACFVILNAPLPQFRAVYLNVTEEGDEAAKDYYVRKPSHKYVASVADFKRIEGIPVAYWLSEKARDAFASGCLVRDVAKPRQGLATSDNGRFLRYWIEVDYGNIGFHLSNRIEAKATRRKWFPLAKGGPVRKWYGNNDYVVNWEDDGREMLAYAAKLYGSPTRTVKNMDFYFREGITWSTISNRFSMRYSAPGAISETKGAMCFASNKTDLTYLLGFSNSLLVESFLKVFSPTLDFHEGPFGKLPFLKSNAFETIVNLVEECVRIARAEWDNFETSWDFNDQPLLRPELKGITLEASWQNWAIQCTAAVRRMQELETENNRLFIAAYGLEDELKPEVPEEQITLARADARKDVAAFLSYAVGCMMGRYSLDKPGLILADAGDTLENYLDKVGKARGEITFLPDEDAIVPVLEGEWFEDDVAARAREFLKVTFGAETLNENLRFIEESLGKPLEKYFLTDFYKDHLQTYKKRPIYWLFQSPKKGFSALMYLHRYGRDTCNILLKYLRDYLHKLEGRIARLAYVDANSTSAKEKADARKEAEKLRKTLKECQEWERETLLPLAQQRIELDLDDGVKVNYLKFGDALATIPGLAAKEEE